MFATMTHAIHWKRVKLWGWTKTTVSKAAEAEEGTRGKEGKIKKGVRGGRTRKTTASQGEEKRRQIKTTLTTGERHDVIDGVLVHGSQDRILLILVVDFVVRVEPGVVREAVTPVEAELVDESHSDVLKEQGLVAGPVRHGKGHVVAEQEVLAGGEQGNEAEVVDDEEKAALLGESPEGGANLRLFAPPVPVSLTDPVLLKEGEVAGVYGDHKQGGGCEVYQTHFVE